MRVFVLLSAWKGVAPIYVSCQNSDEKIKPLYQDINPKQHVDIIKLRIDLQGI
jgi:hypothetical protein